ncbi:hypothetical protein IAR50_001645 [Cryptococcus sp. DSM 104548]
MPAVLLTGITGFLAAHVALTFLKHDWTVHATLRSPSKLPAVQAIPEYKPYLASGQLKLFVVGPLESADYGEAIKGVESVVHTASPVEFGDEGFREKHLGPALEGTRGVLRAVMGEKSVKSVVYTSTFGAVGQHRSHPTELQGRTITEDDWNPYTLEELDTIAANKKSDNPNHTPGVLFYMGSKKYAEIAAWEMQKEARAQGAEWSLAAMNCVMIFGPPIQPMTSLTHGGMSTEFLWMLASGQDADIMDTGFPYYVDVRDAAEAHYQAAVKHAQGRYILSAGPYDFQEFADKLHTLYPSQAGRFPKGTPGKWMYQDPGIYALSNEKSRKELGIEYRPKDETLKDAFDRMFELEQQGFK